MQQRTVLIDLCLLKKRTQTQGARRHLMDVQSPIGNGRRFLSLTGSMRYLFTAKKITFIENISLGMDKNSRQKSSTL